jgi:Ran GTPase-activating protein (RanGAP) involved in mRNA processing and transport
MDNNNIDSLGAVKIAEFLESDPPIEYLSLAHNRLNDDDAIILSRALKTNMNLSYLHLRSNDFTSTGVKALLTCVFDSSSLNAISESNHTLERLILFSFEMSESLINCVNYLLDLDWTDKIMIALNDKESRLQYLANVPVTLMPEVLAFPLRQVDHQREHGYLNIVYSTMQWWNMPLLYSYYICVKSDTKRKREMV